MSLLGINREDLREGKCEKVQGVMAWKPHSAHTRGETPGAFPSPVPGEKYVAIDSNIAQLKAKSQGPLVMGSAVSFPLPNGGLGEIEKTPPRYIWILRYLFQIGLHEI